jgi:cbb3-type cytochrome oxidase maturation protein
MSVIVILILASLAVALVFLSGFFWAVRAGQYDDTSTPSLRVLTEEASTGTDAHKRSSTAYPSPFPSEGRGGATNALDTRTRQAAIFQPTISPHIQSESNCT